MNFQVKRKLNPSLERTVYGVQQLENGLTQFLIFTGEWNWVPADDYVPTAYPPYVHDTK